jgi:hypothetical protein
VSCEKQPEPVRSVFQGFNDEPSKKLNSHLLNGNGANFLRLVLVDTSGPRVAQLVAAMVSPPAKPQIKDVTVHACYESKSMTYIHGIVVDHILK